MKHYRHLFKNNELHELEFLFTGFTEFRGDVVLQTGADFGGELLATGNEAVPLLFSQSLFQLLAGDAVANQSEEQSSIGTACAVHHR